MHPLSHFLRSNDSSLNSVKRDLSSGKSDLIKWQKRPSAQRLAVQPCRQLALTRSLLTLTRSLIQKRPDALPLIRSLIQKRPDAQS
jgi:hypothetical protein